MSVFQIKIGVIQHGLFSPRVLSGKKLEAQVCPSFTEIRLQHTLRVRHGADVLSVLPDGCEMA